jgi:hypothetical protein
VIVEKRAGRAARDRRGRIAKEFRFAPWSGGEVALVERSRYLYFVLNRWRAGVLPMEEAGVSASDGISIVGVDHR